MRLHRIPNRTAGLLRVAAVRKAALRAQGKDLREIIANLAGLHGHDAKTANARGVDQIDVSRHAVHFRKGGGVLPLTVRRADRFGAQGQAGVQGIGQGTLSNARMPAEQSHFISK